MTRVAVVIDPLSTGQAFGPAFREAGFSPVAVLSSDPPAAALQGSWHPENYDQVVSFDGDTEVLARTLRDLDPACVIAGSEPGVDLWDAVVDLVVPGSGSVPELAAARRDKWAMAQACAAAGVPHLRQLCSGDLEEIDKWLHDNGIINTRFVIKPPRSSAGDGVHVIEPGAPWRPVAEKLLGSINVLGEVNDRLLIQEFAAGSEFLVDSYSIDGQHGLVDVCRYTKLIRGDEAGIYDRVQFLPPDHPEVRQVWEYTELVLDAVGVRNGCGHTEVMLTPDGPRLIEIAERPAGGGHQDICAIATGDNHIMRTVRHHTGGPFQDGYQLITNLSGVLINVEQAGVWRNGDLFDHVDELPSFSSKYLPHAGGDWVPASVDLVSALGWVVLVHDDPAVIEADYRHIRELEKQLVIEPQEEPA